MENFKECLNKLDAGENIMKQLNTEIRRLSELQFLTSFHLLKEDIQSLFNNDLVKDLTCKVRLVEEGGSFSITTELVDANLDLHADEISDKLSLIDYELYLIAQDIRGTSKSHFGQNADDVLLIEFSKEFNPDILTDFILNPEKKAIYEMSILDKSLSENSTAKPRKNKI